MDDDVDVYEDMLEDTTSEDVEKLKNEIEERNRVIQKQKAQLVTLESANKNLSHKIERLSTNISSIFLTAKRELTRKEHTINELRQKIDDILFRRHRASDKSFSAVKSEEVDPHNVKKDLIPVQPNKSRYEEGADEKYSPRQYADNGVNRATCDSRLQLCHESAKSAREYSRRSSGVSRDHRRKHISRNEDPHENADCVSSSRNNYKIDEGTKYPCRRRSHDARPRRSSDHHRTNDRMSRSSQSSDDYFGEKSKLSRERRSAGDAADCRRSAPVTRNDRNDDYQRVGNVPRSGKAPREAVDDSRRACKTDSSSVRDNQPVQMAKIVVNARPEEMKSVPNFDYDNTPLKIVQREIYRYATFKFISPIGATPDHIKDKQNEIKAKIGPVPMLNEFRVLEENGKRVEVVTATPVAQPKNGENVVTVDSSANVCNGTKHNDKTDIADPSSVPIGPSVSLLGNGSVAQVTSDDLNNKTVTISCEISEAEHGVFTRKRKRPFRVVISS